VSVAPAALAALHARAIVTPPPWSAAALAATLADPACFLLTAGTGPVDAFLIGRVAAGEAELLTLATDPARRRQGLARRLLGDFARAAGDRGAAVAFLEVAEDNAPARALYAADGWRTAGRRPGYFRPPDGLPVAALILRRTLDGGGGADP